MKRSAIAATALLALCAATLAGCTEYESQTFELKAADVDNVEKQADGTFVHVRISPDYYQNNEKLLVQRREPYSIRFWVQGRFERFEKIDAWLMLNGEKIPFPLDLEFEDAGNIRITPLDGAMSFSGWPVYVLETPWESIETLELHTRFTATVDGATREYNIVTPIEKSYRKGTIYPFWEAMMSV